MDLRSFGQAIKRAVISLIDKDLGNYSIVQVSYNDKTGDCELVSPYGLCSVPPKESLVLMFNVMGQEENRAGIANYPQLRFRGLKEGEVVVGNYLTRSNVKFDSAGNVSETCLLDHNMAIAGSLNIIIGGGINIVCSGAASMDGGGGDFNLNNTTVHLGGAGGRAIARVGDKVEVNGQIGTIIEGGSHFAT